LLLVFDLFSLFIYHQHSILFQILLKLCEPFKRRKMLTIGLPFECQWFTRFFSASLHSAFCLLKSAFEFSFNLHNSAFILSQGVGHPQSNPRFFLSPENARVA